MKNPLSYFSWSDLGVISAAYIVAFTLMLGLVTPLQSILLPEITQYVSLLFLPHGVRVLALHYYGWKAIIYLLPSSTLMWFVVNFGTELDASLVAIIVSLLACYVGVGAVRWITKVSEDDYQSWSWKMLLLAGAICSILNSLSLSFLHFSAPDPLFNLGVYHRRYSGHGWDHGGPDLRVQDGRQVIEKRLVGISNQY